jgi:hypothetical protein
MTTPGFTAEASLTTTGSNYAATFNQPASLGNVVPQWCIGNQCCQCWDEAGFSGCLCHRRIVYSAVGQYGSGILQA